MMVRMMMNNKKVKFKFNCKHCSYECLKSYLTTNISTLKINIKWRRRKNITNFIILKRITIVRRKNNWRRKNLNIWTIQINILWSIIPSAKYTILWNLNQIMSQAVEINDGFGKLGLNKRVILSWHLNLTATECKNSKNGEKKKIT